MRFQPHVEVGRIIDTAGMRFVSAAGSKVIIPAETFRLWTTTDGEVADPEEHSPVLDLNGFNKRTVGRFLTGDVPLAIGTLAMRKVRKASSHA